jgi:hypothetical protein
MNILRSLMLLSFGVLHVMSRPQLRELMVLFVVGWAVTLAVFFLAPFETFTRFPFPRFPGFF